MAAKQKSKPKKKKRQRTRTTDPEQSARFLETAKRLGVDESGDSFAQALSAVLPSKGGKNKS